MQEFSIYLRERELGVLEPPLEGMSPPTVVLEHLRPPRRLCVLQALIVALLGPGRRVLSPLCHIRSRKRKGVMVMPAFAGGAAQTWLPVLKLLAKAYQLGPFHRVHG